MQELREKKTEANAQDVEALQREHVDLIRTLQNQLREKDNELTAVKVSVFWSGCVRAHAVHVCVCWCVR